DRDMVARPRHCFLRRLALLAVCPGRFGLRGGELVPPPRELLLGRAELAGPAGLFLGEPGEEGRDLLGPAPDPRDRGVRGPQRGPLVLERTVLCGEAAKILQGAFVHGRSFSSGGDALPMPRPWDSASP